MEIYNMYRDNAFADHGSWFSKRYDHGVLSYEMMKDKPGYNDIRILASLKHHGHMMEKFEGIPNFGRQPIRKPKGNCGRFSAGCAMPTSWPTFISSAMKTI